MIIPAFKWKILLMTFPGSNLNWDKLKDSSEDVNAKFTFTDR